MLVNCDVKGLELCCAAYLFNDKLMTFEIQSGVDIHANNQRDFELPTRLIAKTLQFRILYGGTEYAFVKDPEFMSVSTNLGYWRRAIERFYDKYRGIRDGHKALLDEVMRTGSYTSPVGRRYKFKPYQTPTGDWKWPRTNILNYPVQGFGADLMLLLRVSFWNRIKKQGLKALPIATVHDSVLVDAREEEVNQVVECMKGAAAAIPGNFLKLFGSEYNLPTVVEIEVGSNYKDMSLYK